MKKLSYALVLFLLVAFSGFATKNNDIEKESMKTVSLSGQVLDHVTGEALAGVKVVIDGSDESSYTDFDGNFSFTNLLPGSYQLSASYISYQKSDVEVSLEETEKVEVKLVQLTK
jgi:hypothetical protein